MVKLPRINLKGLRGKKQSGTFFAIDIGSYAVKCLVYKQSETPYTLEILGAAKEIIEPHVVRAGHIIDLDKVIHAIDEALFRATDGLDEEVSDVIFGVGGSLSACLTTTARVTRASKSEIQADEMNDIHSKIVENALTKSQNISYRTTGNMDSNLELITSSIVYTKLDGNHVKDPLGETGQKLEMALFTAATPSYHVDSLQKIAKALNLDILALTSNMYALNQSMRAAKNDPALDGIIIDIGSDSTNVGVVFGGGVVTSKSLHIGGAEFTNKLSSITGLSFLESERKKHEYSFGNLPDSDLLTIENGLSDITDVWVSGLELLFSDFDGVKTFPTDIYLTGGGSKLPLINEALQNKPWTKSIPFKEPPTFSKVSTNEFKFAHDVTGSTDDEEYTAAVALGSIYLEMLGIIDDQD